MRVLVTGAEGQLGLDVCRCLKKRNIEYMAAGRNECDITSAVSVAAAFESFLPETVINCAAYTAVDKAESDVEKCFLINEEGSRNLALECKKYDIPLLSLSTDYIFSGEGINFYETSDTPAPLSVYGKSKLAGENAIKDILNKYFIIRISWVFGIGGKNFVKTMLRLGKEQNIINVVNDQYGSPTYTKHLAELICDMIVTDKYGIYHATNEGICSWAEFAEEIMRLSGSSAIIKPVPSSEYKTAAVRPKNSRLSKSSLDKAGFKRLPKWQEALKEFLDEI